MIDASTDDGTGFSVRPRRMVTGLLVFALVATWAVLYFVGILGSLWRFGEPDAPAPVLTLHDQMVDLGVLVVQLAVGLAAIAIVLAARRGSLAQVLPERQGTAIDAATAWCAAIAVASVAALVFDRTGLARFDFSAPATVESPWLAVVAALSAGLREEPLLVALPLLLLVGRLPVGWIMVLAGAMRGLLSLHFGAGGFFWAFVWGAGAVWVYYRFRRLWVLILVHGFVMNVQALDRVLLHDSTATLLQWANILILFGALMWWLVPRVLGSVAPIDEQRSGGIPRSTPDVTG